jgi:hypothetical protein
MFLVGCIAYEDIVFRPAFDHRFSPDDFGYAYEEVLITVDSERYTSAWHIFSEESKALFVIIPGSDANKTWYAEVLPLFVPNGFDVLLIDYEGFGESPGEHGFESVLDDAYAAIEYALSQHENVFGYSVSVGTPLLARVAADYDLSGCIFEGSVIMWDFPRLWLIDQNLGIPPVVVVSNIYTVFQTPWDYNIELYIQDVTEPKLFIHSSEDNVAPYSGGLRVFHQAPEPKELWTVHGEHGKMVREDAEKYEEKVVGWMNSILDTD